MRYFMKAICVLVWLASPSLAANQSINTKPDGKIVFAAALSGVTRLSIVGEDRIKELWSTNSAFEAQLNEDTGDMFLRYVGTGKPTTEDGFLVTEQGHTINYTLRPKSTTSETVLIGLKAPEVKSAAPQTQVSFNTTQGGGGDGYSGQIVSFVRQIYATHLDRRAPPRVKSGSVVRNVNGTGMRARILSIAAGSRGGAVQAQKYFRDGVLAVFVDRPVLAPGQRSWVVVVEGR